MSIKGMIRYGAKSRFPWDARALPGLLAYFEEGVSSGGLLGPLTSVSTQFDGYKAAYLARASGTSFPSNATFARLHGTGEWSFGFCITIHEPPTYRGADLVLFSTYSGSGDGVVLDVTTAGNLRFRLYRSSAAVVTLTRAIGATAIGAGIQVIVYRRSNTYNIRVPGFASPAQASYTPSGEGATTNTITAYTGFCGWVRKAFVAGGLTETQLATIQQDFTKYPMIWTEAYVLRERKKIGLLHWFDPRTPEQDLLWVDRVNGMVMDNGGLGYTAGNSISLVDPFTEASPSPWLQLAKPEHTIVTGFAFTDGAEQRPVALTRGAARLALATHTSGALALEYEAAEFLSDKKPSPSCVVGGTFRTDGSAEIAVYSDTATHSFTPWSGAASDPTELSFAPDGDDISASYSTMLFRPLGAGELQAALNLLARTHYVPIAAPTPAVPQFASMIMWLDPAYGITESGGLVSAWASRVGSAVFSAAGGARPTLGAGYLDFDGAANVMTRPADAQSHPAGAGLSTFAAWVWADSIATTLKAPFATATDVNGVWYQVTSVINVQYATFGAGSHAATTRNFTEAGWRFIAGVFNGSLAPGSRIIQYYGESVGGIALVAGSESGATATVPAAAGDSSLGSDSSYSRFWDGRLGNVGLWSGAALTAAELAQFATATAP